MTCKHPDCEAQAVTLGWCRDHWRPRELEAADATAHRQRRYRRLRAYLAQQREVRG